VLGPRAAFYFPPEQVPAIYYAGSLRKAVQVLLGEPLLFPSSLVLYPATIAKLFTPRTAFLVLEGGLALLANFLLLFRAASPAKEAHRGFTCVTLACAARWVPAYAFGVLGQWWFDLYFFALFPFMTMASGPLLDHLGSSGLLIRVPPARLAATAASLHLLLFAFQVPEQFLQHKPYRNVLSYIEAARALDRALPAGARGGAFQSGTIGYFARHPVVNLDGVVNRDATAALRQSRMAEYIRSERIEAIIDWPLWIEALLVRRSPAGEGRNLGPAHHAGQFLLIRVSPTMGLALGPSSRP